MSSARPSDFAAVSAAGTDERWFGFSTTTGRRRLSEAYDGPRLSLSHTDERATPHRGFLLEVFPE